MAKQEKKARTYKIRTEKEIKNLLAQAKKCRRGERMAFYKKNSISANHISVWSRRFSVVKPAA